MFCNRGNSFKFTIHKVEAMIREYVATEVTTHAKLGQNNHL